MAKSDAVERAEAALARAKSGGGRTAVQEARAKVKKLAVEAAEARLALARARDALRKLLDKD